MQQYAMCHVLIPHADQLHPASLRRGVSGCTQLHPVLGSCHVCIQLHIGGGSVLLVTAPWSPLCPPSMPTVTSWSPRSLSIYIQLHCALTPAR